MHGRVDRGGSREGKKSLRKNKINIVEKIKKGDGEKKDTGPITSPIGMLPSYNCIK